MALLTDQLLARGDIDGELRRMGTGPDALLGSVL